LTAEYLWDSQDSQHQVIIVLMMEAAHTSETSVDIQLRTLQYIPQDSEHQVIIVLMMEAARTSETSVDIQLRTLQYIPEDSEHQVIMFKAINSYCCYGNNSFSFRYELNVKISFNKLQLQWG
jgi:predicted class III extradiol MEMO1 family dioxygenase